MYDKHPLTCLQGDMHPNMDEELLLPHPHVVPSLAESSNEELAFGRGEVHTEGYSGVPFPKTK